MPKVSVIIPTHNRLELLKKAIRSVQRQSYTDWELIVVEHACSDGTAEYLKPLAQAGDLRLLRMGPEEPGNGNEARNRGVRAAAGEYLAFLDDDDEWLPDKLTLQVALLDAHPECGLCGCSRILCRDDGSETPEDPAALREGDLSREIFYSLFFVSSTLVFRREALLKAGLFDPQQEFWQDYDLVIRLCQQTRVCCVRQQLVRYRVGLSDPNRLTNKYAQWKKTVEAQNRKYALLLQKLTPEETLTREMMILQDALVRSETSGETAEHKSWRKRYYELKPSAAAWICWKLNLSKAATDRLHCLLDGAKLFGRGLTGKQKK